MKQDWLQASLATAGHGVITTDDKGSVIFLNQVAQSLTGWDQEKAVGQPLSSVFRIVDEDSLIPVAIPTDRIVREGIIFGLAEHRLLSAEESAARLLDDIAVPIHSHDGEVTGVVVFFRDITGRREKERGVENALAYAENIISALREPFLVLDSDLRVVSGNTAFLTTFRASMKEIEGRFFFELDEGQWNNPGLRAMLEDLLAHDHPIENLGLKLNLPSVGRRDLLINASLLHSVEGRPALVLLAIEDQTKLKAAEAVLRVIETRYRRLFETSRDGILILDAVTGRILDANPFMSERLGYSHEELVGKELWEIGLLGDVAASKLAAQELKDRGFVRYENLPLVHKDGKHIDVEFVSNVYEENGRNVAQCIIRDTTERMANEVKLRRQATLMNKAHDAIFMYDSNGRIIYWNEGAAALYGWNNEEALAQDAHQLLRTQFPKPSSEFLADLKRDGSWEGELVQTSRDGKQIIVVSRWVLDRDEPGPTQTTLEINHDITDRKRREKLQVLWAEELVRSNRDLEQFAYVASHDLQEPLRTVGSYVGLLAERYRGKLDEKADKYIDFVVEAASRMKVQISDLLAYSRLGAGRMKPQAIDTSAALAEAVQNLDRTIRESGAVLTLDTLQNVWGDYAQLSLVFQNLIGNAIKFCREKPPRIHVSGERKGESWLFSVRDNGIGIDPKHADRIFVIFQRLHGRQEFPGTGMGLAICKKIVESHGGRIWVESQPGQGSTFFFTIPTNPLNIGDSLNKIA